MRSPTCSRAARCTIRARRPHGHRPGSAHDRRPAACDLYVMPLGGRDAEKVVAALDRNKRFLRGEIAHRVNLKFAPDIRFRVDERFEEAERIEKLLRTPAGPPRSRHAADNDRRTR